MLSGLLHPESYSTIIVLFPRLLGLIYFCAIGAFWFQMRGLLGSNGILPIQTFLKRMDIRYLRLKKYYYIPTLFWINSSDFALMGVVVLGVICSIVLMLGFYPALMLLLLYILHLSIVSAGQDFLAFGWEGLLLEITVHAFLMSLTPIPNLAVWISINFLLFRFHIQAGLVKLQSRDYAWRDLTAIGYHYQSQPLPVALAWYAYKLPLWFQKFSTFMMFVTELVIPFGIFGSDTVRAMTFVALFGLQFLIWLTGNFSYLNHLTAVLCTILLSDRILGISLIAPSPDTSFSILNIFLTGCGIALLTLQVIRMWGQLWPHPKLSQILQTIAPFHLVNRYGIFAMMTKDRYEIVIEGSEDGQIWKEYLFKYKPSEITRRPRRISPYQPRIDWQVWFLPFSDFEVEEWFQNFLAHLLKGTPEVLKLLRLNPFPDKPPQYLIVSLYDYKFSSFEEKRAYGWWWKRELVGRYTPRLSLKTHSDA